MNQRQRNAWIEAAKEQVLRNAEASDGCEADLMELYDECVNPGLLQPACKGQSADRGPGLKAADGKGIQYMEKLAGRVP